MVWCGVSVDVVLLFFCFCSGVLFVVGGEVVVLKDFFFFFLFLLGLVVC